MVEGTKQTERSLHLHRPIVRFLLAFAVWYAVLIIPWPGWNEIYGNYFRWLGQTTLGGTHGDRIVRFEKTKEPIRPGLTTTILIANRKQFSPDGRGPIYPLQAETRSIGWMPTAFLIALVLATPVPWGRRLVSLTVGLLLVNAYVVFCLGIWIWHSSKKAQLVSFAPLTEAIAGGLEYTLITQLGATFAVPVVIWLLVTFRKGDFDLLWDELETTTHPESGSSR